MDESRQATGTPNWEPPDPSAPRGRPPAPPGQAPLPAPVVHPLHVPTGSAVGWDMAAEPADRLAVAAPRAGLGRGATVLAWASGLLVGLLAAAAGWAGTLPVAQPAGNGAGPDLAAVTPAEAGNAAGMEAPALAEAFEDLRPDLEVACSRASTAPTEQLRPQEALLAEEALLDLGVISGPSLTLSGSALADAALLGTGQDAQELLTAAGSPAGGVRRSTGTFALDIAYMDFATDFDACVFAEFDYIFHPGGDQPTPILEVPTAWMVAVDGGSVLHFRADDRLYMIHGEGDREDLLRAVAIAQAQHAGVAVGEAV